MCRIRERCSWLPSWPDGRLETDWRLCLTESQQSKRWDALQRKIWVERKNCFDFSLFIGERGVKLFYLAEYCDTLQSKEKRNLEHKAYLNDRALPFQFVVPTLRWKYPLSDLDGLNIWYESRLLEEGIEDMQNLATANLVDVILNTSLKYGSCPEKRSIAFAWRWFTIVRVSDTSLYNKKLTKIPRQK